MAFTDFMYKIKEDIRRMLGLSSTLEQVLNLQPAISTEMTNAINMWSDLYEDKAPWLHEPDASNPVKVVSLGIPAFIASEKARMAVLELKSEISAPKKVEEVDNPNYFPPMADGFGGVKVSGVPKSIIQETPIGDTARADYLNEQYQKKLLSKIRTQLEYGIAKGSLIIKPYVVKHTVKSAAGVSSPTGEDISEFTIEFDFVQADCFYPLAFDSSGNITEVAFVQSKVDKDKTFSRVEHHKLVGNKVVIINKAYETTNSNHSYNPTNSALGVEVPLNAVYEWKDIQPKAEIHNVDRMMFGYFKMPDANTIDPRSPLGVSGFSKAITLIREADLQFSRFLWEFEGGELALDIDRDAMQFMADGHTTMSMLQQRLYRTIDLGESDTYKPFSPMLRDGSLINGLNTILTRIEDVCALSRGTLSVATTEARTATEIKILRQRSFSANSEIQKALKQALEDTVYAMSVYCTLYNIVGDATPDSVTTKIDTNKIGRYDVSFEFDDSLLVDVETETQVKLQLVNAGLEGKEEFRMWYFGETRAQARTALEKIAEASQLAIERNMAVSSQLGQAIGGNKPQGEQPNPNDSSTQAKNEAQSQVQKQGNGLES